MNYCKNCKHYKFTANVYGLCTIDGNKITIITYSCKSYKATLLYKIKQFLSKYDMETLMQPKETKARKQHYCNFCNERIIVGEKYMKSTHIYDGGIYDWKSHKHCSKLAHSLNMYDECDEGVTMDYFMESVSEKHDDILISQIPEKDVKKYSDIIRQLMRVRFNDKLWFVIRHLNKLESKINS